MIKILIFIIKIYQFLISPLFGSKCRFLPTCSEYFIEALKNHGILKGFYFGIKRILKCHPFKKSTESYELDFVPPSRNCPRKNYKNFTKNRIEINR